MKCSVLLCTTNVLWLILTDYQNNTDGYGQIIHKDDDKLHFINDVGFDFASQTTQDIKWGRA